MLSEKTVKTYTDILKEELVLAMGCTEPIAIAYAAAVMADLLGGKPSRIRAGLSGNIIKNVKSVIVPATGGMRGIAAAVAAGTVAACPERKLEVLCSLKKEDIPEISAYIENTPIEIYELDTDNQFELLMEAELEGSHGRVHLVNRHTNIELVEKNGEDLTSRYRLNESDTPSYAADRGLLNVHDIIEFAETVDLAELEPTLRRQIDLNMAIAQEGLSESYGASIGRLIYSNGRCGIRDSARAYAAAGSDARMSGCEMPVCIISGSGNQGITASVPVVVYAQIWGSEQETLLRALIVSDLITVHLKSGIGCLSAYCGAISAGCGSGCGICYLGGGRYYEIAHTLVNSIAILSGTICDGAKASCAAKIAMAVKAGVMGYEMMKSGRQFYGGDGIVTKGVENTIKNVGKLARDGMSETDREIIRIMLEKN
ncbi:MAG: serine dehydratase subunit alpha family protein [Clostridia bacterium]|nr:serine dehydratase subunit alpha family protein [Clostridia bacterium]